LCFIEEIYSNSNCGLRLACRLLDLVWWDNPSTSL
jgi:hypothetical protein